MTKLHAVVDVDGQHVDQVVDDFLKQSRVV